MPRAVILTALPVEYLAVRAHLTALQEETHPQGTIYERGRFTAEDQIWAIGIVEIGAGNPGAALEAERAINYFNPDILFFVGIAGGIQDVAIGDVIAATKVYGYESGRAGAQFLPHPEVGQSSYALMQRARREAKKTDWLNRLSSIPAPPPQVFVAPIAAGERVVVSRQSDIFQFLRMNYNDAIAVEMEGYGFLKAAFAHTNIKAIVIRGISDLIGSENDASGEPEQVRQERAAQHASAFAFEMLAKYLPKRTKRTLNQQQIRIIGKATVLAGVLLAAIHLATIFPLPSSPISWGPTRLIPDDKPCARRLEQARNEKKSAKEVIAENVQCNDPEGWIYINNAEAEQSPNSIRLVISVAIDRKQLGKDDSLEMLRGVAQAQNEINQNGGINGRKLLIGIADDKEDNSQAEAIARTLVERSDVWGSIGQGSSSTTAAAGKIYDGNLVAISPTSTAIRQSDEYHDGLPLNSYIFRTASNDAIAAQNLVDHALNESGKERYERAAIVYESVSSYSQSLRQAFSTKFKAQGGRVVYECDSSTKSLTPAECLAEPKSVQVLLLIPTESAHVEAIIARNQQSKFHLLGGDTMYNRSILRLGGVQGMIVAIPWHRNGSKFEQNGAQLFGPSNLNWRSAMTYDAAQAFRSGLKIALDEGCETGPTPCRKKLQEVLSRSDFAADGVLGEKTVRFDSSGDRSIKGLEGKLGILVRAGFSTFVPVP